MNFLIQLVCESLSESSGMTKLQLPWVRYSPTTARQLLGIQLFTGVGIPDVVLSSYVTLFGLTSMNSPFDRPTLRRPDLHQILREPYRTPSTIPLSFWINSNLDMRQSDERSRLWSNTWHLLSALQGSFPGPAIAALRERYQSLDRRPFLPSSSPPSDPLRASPTSTTRSSIPNLDATPIEVDEVMQDPLSITVTVKRKQSPVATHRYALPAMKRRKLERLSSLYTGDQASSFPKHTEDIHPVSWHITELAHSDRPDQAKRVSPAEFLRPATGSKNNAFQSLFAAFQPIVIHREFGDGHGHPTLKSGVSLETAEDLPNVRGWGKKVKFVITDSNSQTESEWTPYQVQTHFEKSTSQPNLPEPQNMISNEMSSFAIGTQIKVAQFVLYHDWATRFGVNGAGMGVPGNLRYFAVSPSPFDFCA
ncbi:hypothetical protein P7C73_g4611, partial [Tremellales sp. Uapishka_1]